MKLSQNVNNRYEVIHMNFKKSRNLMWIGFMIGTLIMAVGTSLKKADLFLIIGSVVFVVSLIQAFVFYACPYCGYSLMNVRGNIPEYCPKCGKEL